MEYFTNAPAGAALLDEKRPGYADEIDLETFKIDNSRSCVLGQLYGDYWRGKEELFRGVNDIQQAHSYGFATLYLDDVTQLQAEWVSLIRERQT